MTPEFDAWFAEYRRLQQDRERGAGGDVWAKIRGLEFRLDRLAVGGLDARNTALNLLALERACILYEEREYRRALQELASVDPAWHVPINIAGILRWQRGLLEGNILLLNERLDEAIPCYQAAKSVPGDAATEVRANAAFNLGVIRQLRAEFDLARAEFEYAAREYRNAELPVKVADCMHQLGLLLREKDETLGEALRFLLSAMDTHIRADNMAGVWRTSDDIARLWLIWSECAKDDSERVLCHQEAMRASLGAARVAARLWRDPGPTEGRLADLSDQILNHTMTHCEICALNDDMPELFGTLAVSKGRIRALAEPVPPEAIAGETPDLLDALKADDPRAYLALVHKVFPRLNVRGEVIAVVDQLGLRGDRLVSAVTVLGGEPYWEVFQSFLYSPEGAPARRSLRGRDRCLEAESIAARVIQGIRSHSNRCSMVLGEDAEPTTVDQRDQLADWASEFDDDLVRLGAWFFPAGLLRMLSELKVEHVVLIPDPLFATVPYPALKTAEGCVVDSPWSLSIVTTSLELLRLAYRPSGEGPARPIVWMGPDADVNERLGGDAELEDLSAMLEVEERREQDATLEYARAALADGRWVHFRGHGSWRDDVATSGPVFANGEILDRAALESIDGDAAGFLVTAACFTGFATAVGSEAFGSLVDYDRAGLQGALLTRWPIHGPAAAPFMRRFYSALIGTAHVGKALQQAARQTRDAAPHPFFWAPFVSLGAWEAQPR